MPIIKKKMKNKKVNLIIMKILIVIMKILECFKKINSYLKMRINSSQKMQTYKKIQTLNKN